MENSWYKHSPSDWLAGRISRKSFEVQGAFIHLCQLYWVKHGQFTIHQATLEIGKDLLERLTESEIVKTEGDEIRIEFLDMQMEDLNRLIERRREAGRKGGQASAKQIEASAKQNQASAKQTEADKIRLDKIRKEEIRKEEIKNTCAMFDQFWAIYPRKTGKQAASKSFAKLSNADQQEAMNNISRLYAQTPVQFVPHAATYLNGKRWEDQAIQRTPTFTYANLTDESDPLPIKR
jgi:general stress protein YciG